VLGLSRSRRILASCGRLTPYEAFRVYACVPRRGSRRQGNVKYPRLPACGKGLSHRRLGLPLVPADLAPPTARLSSPRLDEALEPLHVASGDPRSPPRSGSRFRVAGSPAASGRQLGRFVLSRNTQAWRRSAFRIGSSDASDGRQDHDQPLGRGPLPGGTWLRQRSHTSCDPRR
jgi:hypothetical protein